MSVLVLWIAVHRYPWLGPLIADNLRALLGPERVSRIEDFVYGLEDTWNQWWRSDEAPKAYWEVPTTSAAPPPPPASSADDSPPPPPPFLPKDVGPLHGALAAQGDGVWVPVPDPADPSAPPLMFKTLIHPDRKRPWAELFVVAMDLTQIELHLVAGSAEPRALTAEGRKYERSGLIPDDDQKRLLAGFNGGFKMEHGRWGMRIDGVTLVQGRAHGCTIAKEKAGQLVIAPWQELEERHESFVWWRQTPPCMYLKGERHGGLWDPEAKGWGAALEGDTVIRRSAFGLDEERKVLFVSVSNHTSARAIADGMHHAGAANVAQLDVNWSFPRFVVFPEDRGKRYTRSLFEGFEVDEDDYLREPNARDFFYVVREASAGR
ncbi:MAG TPA: hypothetical protein ENK57_13235 [Polyangiaceae bacterium]|nr:hypothetical protein [Polyangiaceae bacterium]